MARKKYSSRPSSTLPAREQRRIDELFPAVAEWVYTTGWIEIGDQEGFGFIVRAVGYGGTVYESKKPKTLAQALSALDRALAHELER